ncbi:hypothetical protein CFI00_0145 [Nocardioides sp. S5]|nr:hypothetical protein CFI00_0145 [Nocardioides sp. S5]
MVEKLDDTWHPRDLPILITAARRLEAHGRPAVSDEIARELSFDAMTVARALDSMNGAYLTGKASRAAGHGTIVFICRGLTERGRRAVGLWPDEDAAADSLVQLLEQASEQVDDEDDQSALRRAGKLLRGVPSAVIADVTAALIRQQSGL